MQKCYILRFFAGIQVGFSPFGQEKNEKKPRAFRSIGSVRDGMQGFRRGSLYGAEPCAAGKRLRRMGKGGDEREYILRKRERGGTGKKHILEKREEETKGNISGERKGKRGKYILGERQGVRENVYRENGYGVRVTKKYIYQ